MKRIPLLAMMVAFVFSLAMVAVPSQVDAASSATIESYIRSTCSRVHPIDSCAQYDGEVTEARYKVMRIMDIIKAQSATDQQTIVNSLLSMLSKAYDASYGEKRFLSAYYYVSLLDLVDTNLSSDDLFDYLFGGSSSSSTTYTYTYDDDDDYRYTYADGGEIVRVLSDNGYTTVDSSRRRISARSGMLALRIKAEDERGRAATPSNGYRVIAMFDNSRYDHEVYGANYENNGYWEFRFASQFSSSDDVTFYLLCSNCDEGSRFNRGSTFRNRRVMDTERYDLSYSSYSTNRNRYYDDYRYRYNDSYYDDQDLGIVDVEYEYEIYSNEVQVEVTTRVRNYGDDEITLNEIDYDVEVDNRTLSSSRYDIRHLETDCDDSRVSRNDDEDIDIEEGDECEITVRFDFDDDDVEDERVEIEVMLNARGDDRSSNDDETIVFYVR